MVNKLLAKCLFPYNAQQFAREVGCPLDHCACGTHDANNEFHTCEVIEEEFDLEVAAAERAAGWDSCP